MFQIFKKFKKNKAEIIKNTDPDRIYIENVRSFFNIPTKLAKFLCDVAVRQNLFIKKIAIECINHDCKRIIQTFNVDEKLPEEINCIVCELENKEKFTFNKSEYKIIEFYQLVKDEHK